MTEEKNWVELPFQKFIAVIRCRTCGYVGRNEDYDDYRIGSRILLHCPQCNQHRYFTLIQKIAMVDMEDVMKNIDIQAIADEVSKLLATKTKKVIGTKE